MIFTFGPPDVYILPKDVLNSTHLSKEGDSDIPIQNDIQDDILCLKISHCNCYVFILTKNDLFAYSNGSEFVYLGRLRLSELQLSEFDSFRDLVILPVNNLIALLVNNEKHLLIVNYYNPSLNESTINNTPIQSPTNQATTHKTITLSSSGSATTTANLPADTPSATPVSTTTVNTIVNNKLPGTATIGTRLNRILHPIENEEVGDLRDTFFMYLKNFLNFSVVYHILVPSDFSFMFVENQQFLFWIEAQSGLYSTITPEGFLNLLINHYNSSKRKADDCKRISLYLVTTNLLNNVNITGNIHLSYGLCYINLSSLTIRHLSDTHFCRMARFSVVKKALKGNKNNLLTNLFILNENKSLFDLINSCIAKINSINSKNAVSNRTRFNKEGSREEKADSIDANNILDMLATQGADPEDLINPSQGKRSKPLNLAHKLMKDIKRFYIVNNYLFMLTSSHVLLYINIHRPLFVKRYGLTEEQEERIYSNSDVYISESEEEKPRKGMPDSSRMRVFGRLLFDNVEKLFGNSKHRLVCILFTNNVISIYHLNCFSRIVATLSFKEAIEDIIWLETYLIVLTNDCKLHFYTYSLKLVHTTSINYNKIVHRHVNGISSIFRTQTSSLSHSISISEKNNTTSRADNDNVDTPNDSNEDKFTASKGLLLCITNNRKLLIYKHGEFHLFHPFINYGGNSNFNVFLNNNNMFIVSSSSFFSPTISSGPCGTGVNKDMFLLRLPNLNHVEKDDNDDGEERPHRIQVVKDIKINNTGNYILIHHSTIGVNEHGGLILYNNNKYTYANTNINTNDIYRLNWFTNHIFYTIYSEGLPNKPEPLFGIVPEEHSEYSYDILFYSINDTNEVLIKIGCYNRPVCTCKDDPYLFMVLDSDGQVVCYDLFFINYKEVYSFNLSNLRQFVDKSEIPSEKDEPKDTDLCDQCESDASAESKQLKTRFDYDEDAVNWVEMYVFGRKKFLLLNGYRELFLFNDKYIQQILDNVNQVEPNLNLDNRYEYIVTTKNSTYLLYNQSEFKLNRETMPENNGEDEQDGAGFCKDRKYWVRNEYNNNYSDSNSDDSEMVYSTVVRSDGCKHKKLLGTSYLGMCELKSSLNTGHLLSINDNIAFTLNTNMAININLMFLPTFLFNEDDALGIDLSGDCVDLPKFKNHLFMEYLIYYLNLLHREHSKKTATIKKELMENLTNDIKHKLFSVFSRKNIELDKILDQEREFNISCEDCFNYLLEHHEYEYASLLLLPLQIESDPYKVRNNQCKSLVERLLMAIIESTPQKGRKMREKNKSLLQLLVKFYNRLPNPKSIDKSPSHQDTDGRDEEPGSNEAFEPDESNKNVVEGAESPTEPPEYTDLGMDEHRPPDRGIDEVIDVNELIESLLLKLNFMAIYKLSFLNREGIGRMYVIDDVSSYDGQVSSPDSQPTNTADDNSDKEAPSGNHKYSYGLHLLELNTILYFMIESNHINYDFGVHKYYRNCHLNSFLMSDRMLFYMLIGYKSYIGLSSLVLRNDAIHDYIKHIYQSTEDTPEGKATDRLSLLRNVLANIKSTYTPL